MSSTFIAQYGSILKSVAVLTMSFILLEMFRPAQPQRPVRSRAFNLLYLPWIVAWILALQFVFAPLFTLLLVRTE